jgi:hypothetical protein
MLRAYGWSSAYWACGKRDVILYVSCGSPKFEFENYENGIELVKDRMWSSVIFDGRAFQSGVDLKCFATSYELSS